MSTSRALARLRFAPVALLFVIGASLAVRKARRATVSVSAPRPEDEAAASVASTGAKVVIAPASPSAKVPEHAARMLHGDARHTNRAKAEGPRADKLVWSRDVGGPVEAQVVTSPDEATLYVATLAGALVALARDGSVRWTFPLGDRAYGTPLVGDDGTVYEGSDAKRFGAVTAQGREKWTLEVDGEADTSATFDGRGRIVFAAGNAVFAATRDGALAWRFRAGGKVYGSPAVTDQGRVVFGAQDGHVYGLDADGKRVFSTDVGGDVDTAIAVGEQGELYAGTDAGEVIRLDEAGGVTWRTAVGGYVRGALSVARNGDVLAGVYGPTPRVVRIDPSGAIVASLSVAGTGSPDFGVHGAPLEDGAGVLYFGAQDDSLRATTPALEVLFRHETGGDVDAPATLLSDGALVFASDDGKVYYLGR